MQLDYDYFVTSECKILKSKVQTNPRYKNFTQLYYTIGDVEQFWVARNLNIDKKENVSFSDTIEPTFSLNNLFKNIDTFLPFEGYKNVSDAQVEDTFNYIFQKFKKGIYVRIKDGMLESFIPFSKAFYVNEWSNLIKIDPKYGSIENFFKVHHNLTNKLNKTNYKFNPYKLNFNPNFWYANNCILRYENPINEGDNNYAQLKSMFLELCAERHLPDIEFFVNRRDFPILTRNMTEPYYHIFGDNVPLKSHKFDKYIPILSMCSSDKFADVAIPTFEDWARIKSEEGVFFPPKCRNYKFNFNLKWKEKKSMAVFRGSNTGCGYNTNNNIRLKLAKLGLSYPLLLNVGITNWNLRIRKNKDSEYLQIPDIEQLQLVDKLTPQQQSNYKYLINVDGHVSAFRLSLELSMGCCILLVESAEKWKMWFSDMLEPYVHYVPIKSDLSDLIDQINWCKKHDEECQKIAQNSLNFYNKYLTKKGVLDYLEKVLFVLKDNMYGNNKPNFLTLDPLLFQTDIEHEVLVNENLQALEAKEYKVTGLFPKNVGRNYGVLKGLERFIKMSVKPDSELTLVKVEVRTIFKSKTTRVILYQIGAEYVVGKKTIDPMKKIEFIHEAFIGKYVINNLLKICPNFVFTLSYRDEPYISYMYSDYCDKNNCNQTMNNLTIKENTVIQEYIKGPTLQEFLKTCTMKSYLEILLSLNCALIIAQSTYGFVHHDLKPWNIVVNILPEPIILEYYLRTENNQDYVYKIKTKYIPVIIDYGKSHVIYNNVHYGIIEPYSINKYIDFVTLLLSTINELIIRLDGLQTNNKENVDFNAIQDLLFLVNFLSFKNITTISDLKMFLFKTKKFGNLDKNDLKLEVKSSKTLFEEFFKYMVPMTKKYKISFGKSTLTLNTWSSNARQIADMGFGLEVEDKVNSYLEVVRRIYKNPLPQATNRFTTIMIAQKMFDGLIKPKMEFIEYATEINLNQKKVESVLKEFNTMEKFLMDFYTNQLNRKIRESFSVGVNQKQYEDVLKFELKPSRRLFLESIEIKDKVIQEMTYLPAQFPDYMHYRSLILDVLRNIGQFKIQDDDKKFYMDNFKLIFDEEFVSKVVNIETIRFFINN
jgi:hypothetical protein